MAFRLWCYQENVEKFYPSTAENLAIMVMHFRRLYHDNSFRFFNKVIDDVNVKYTPHAETPKNTMNDAK